MINFDYIQEAIEDIRAMLRRLIAGAADDVELMTVETFLDRYGIGRTRLYELIGEKKLDARKDGRRTLITGESARNWKASLPAL